METATATVFETVQQAVLMAAMAARLDQAISMETARMATRMDHRTEQALSEMVAVKANWNDQS